jgi:hypothetical protein
VFVAALPGRNTPAGGSPVVSSVASFVDPVAANSVGGAWSYSEEGSIWCSGGFDDGGF